MCTLPQLATNSVAHMMNAMNKVLQDCIPEITMLFLDDIPMKGCAETMDDRGLRESASKDRRCASSTFRGEIGISARRDIGGRTSMWALWPKTVTNQN